jgi:hypothetical protein
MLSQLFTGRDRRQLIPATNLEGIMSDSKQTEREQKLMAELSRLYHEIYLFGWDNGWSKGYESGLFHSAEACREKHEPAPG